MNNLDSIVNLLGPVPGVSSAYLYVGTWRSMFAYHVEDLDLYSINYLHAGCSKSWYSIKQKDKKRFESLAVSYFVEEHQQCKEFLRHKTKIFSPIKLKEYGIQYTTAIHFPGEFIITFPGAYHAGFNHGLNVAESTNFATKNWFEIGKKAKRCICRPHSVQINVSRLETLFLRNEKLKNNDMSCYHSNKIIKNGSNCDNDENDSDDNSDESESDNSQNENEDIDEIITRRYRCICSTDGIIEINEKTPISVCCSKCSLWGHLNCYNELEINLNSNLIICFMCTAIEEEVIENTFENNGENRNENTDTNDHENEKENKNDSNFDSFQKIKIKRDIDVKNSPVKRKKSATPIKSDLVLLDEIDKDIIKEKKKRKFKVPRIKKDARANNYLLQVKMILCLFFFLFPILFLSFFSLSIIKNSFY